MPQDDWSAPRILLDSDFAQSCTVGVSIAAVGRRHKQTTIDRGLETRGMELFGENPF